MRKTKDIHDISTKNQGALLIDAESTPHKAWTLTTRTAEGKIASNNQHSSPSLGQTSHFISEVTEVQRGYRTFPKSYKEERNWKAATSASKVWTLPTMPVNETEITFLMKYYIKSQYKFSKLENLKFLVYKDITKWPRQLICFTSNLF